MEEGEQYSEYSVERNPSAYMSMRDYRNLPWKSQQPVERNPNPSRSMRDYRNPPWMSAPFCSVSPTNTPFDNTYNPSWGNHTNSSWEPRPLQYTPPASPYYTLTPQPPQSSQLTSSVENAILNLSKLVDNFIEEKRAVNGQANQDIDTMESSLKKELDVFQREIDQKSDILQQSISKLTNQLVHQEEVNLEEECLTDTILGAQAQLQLQEELKEEPAEAPKELQDAPESYVVYGSWRREEIIPLLIEKGCGKEAVEEHQEHNLPLPPIDSVYILPAPSAHSNPGTPTTKAIPPTLLVLQNFRKLVATTQIFTTTSNTFTAAHTAWHNGWFGCWFRHGAPGPQQFH